MIWSTNYGRLLSQTVFTLFFAGRDFAPLCIIDGQNIQDYLQEHYMEAMGQMADRIRDAGGLMDECVIGWDSLNEPFEGLCGWEDLNVNPTKQGSTLKKGTHPTPYQSLRLGMGQPQTVENWSFGAMGPSRDGSVTIDPKGLTLWADPRSEGADGVNPRWGWKRDPGWVLGTCIWALHGVWDVESGFLLQPDYFKYGSDGAEVEFITDYWKPHWIAFSRRIRASHPEAIIFVQPPVFALPPSIPESELRGRCAYSGHYYDGLTLVSRHWNWFNADALGLLRGKYSSTLQAVKIGTSAIRKSLQEQLGYLKADALILGPYPTIIGEIGTPMDMDGKRSYGWTDGGKHKGDYVRQERALDASLNGGDGGNAIGWTVWTYAPDSTHEWGDGWNMEDLSLWSADDLKESEWGDDDELGDQESMYGIQGESQAVLLRKYKSSGPRPLISVHSVSASSTSLAASLNSGIEMRTIPPPRTTRMTRTRGRQAIGPAGYHYSPYHFLTDGARAVRAFCRPWPRKVVGRPKDIGFDIGKGVFRLVVGVRPEDRVEEGLATEIYIPLVHYASEEILLGRSGRKRDVDTDTESTASASSRLADDSAVALNGTVAAPQPHLAIPAVTVPAFLSDISTAATLSTPASPTSTTFNVPIPGINFSPLIAERDLLDIEVHISDGRWSVEGQILKWWYDTPNELAEGEGEKEYVIEVQRRGGVIKTNETGCILPGADATGDGDDGLCERMYKNVEVCVEGCCVM